MDDVTLITLILGAWGATLSTLLGLVSVFYYFRRFGVRLDIGHNNIEGQMVMSLQGFNSGKRPVHIKGYNIVVDNGIQGRDLYTPVPSTLFVKPNTPCTLKDGDAIAVFLDLRHYANYTKKQGYQGIIKIRGCFDSMNKRFYSKQMKFDLNKEYSEKDMKVLCAFKSKKLFTPDVSLNQTASDLLLTQPIQPNG